jgi:hypothetical protein
LLINCNENEVSEKNDFTGMAKLMRLIKGSGTGEDFGGNSLHVGGITAACR